MDIKGIELVKKTNKFAFFTVNYRSGFFKREVTDTCFVHVFTEKHLTTTIYEYGKDYRWWKGPSQWHAVSAWVHMNDKRELMELLNV